MTEDMDTELVKHIRITGLEISLGVHPAKAVHGFCTQLREFGQRGDLSLEEMTRMRATLGRWTDEHADGWAEGYAEGWATAILRVLDQREIPMSDEIHGYIATHTDLKTLALWLDMSFTVTHAKDLIKAERADRT